MREHHNAMYRVWIYYICKMIAEVSYATLSLFGAETVLYLTKQNRNREKFQLYTLQNK